MAHFRTLHKLSTLSTWGRNRRGIRRTLSNEGRLQKHGRLTNARVRGRDSPPGRARQPPGRPAWIRSALFHALRSICPSGLFGFPRCRQLGSTITPASTKRSAPRLPIHDRGMWHLPQALPSGAIGTDPGDRACRDRADVGCGHGYVVVLASIRTRRHPAGLLTWSSTRRRRMWIVLTLPESEPPPTFATDDMVEPRGRTRI